MNESTTFANQLLSIILLKSFSLVRTFCMNESTSKQQNNRVSNYHLNDLEWLRMNGKITEREKHPISGQYPTLSGLVLDHSCVRVVISCPGQCPPGQWPSCGGSSPWSWCPPTLLTWLLSSPTPRCHLQSTLLRTSPNKQRLNMEHTVVDQPMLFSR